MSRLKRVFGQLLTLEERQDCSGYYMPCMISMFVLTTRVRVLLLLSSDQLHCDEVTEASSASSVVVMKRHSCKREPP